MRSKGIKVSVCIITYNHEKFIRKCLEGVVNQKIEQEYKIIIGEDKSTDNTLEICKEYKEKYPHMIELLERPQNLGLIDNWIDTLAHCDGDYIALCEGDDFWTDPIKLQKQVDFLEENKSYSLCATKTQRINEKGEKGENTAKMYGEISLDDVLRQNQFGTCTVVLRSKFLEIPFFDNLNGFFGTDWPLWCFMLSKGPGYNSRDLTATYHVHSGGASSGRDKINILRNKLEDRMLMMENFPRKKKIIKNYGLKIIFNYTWKSLMGQKKYYKALWVNKKLVSSYLIY